MEDINVLLLQRDNLIDALSKVLAANEAEAKAQISYQNARENFIDCSDERKAHERAMVAAMDAERKARTMLLTLRK